MNKFFFKKDDNNIKTNPFICCPYHGWKFSLRKGFGTYKVILIEGKLYLEIILKYKKKEIILY